MRRILLAALIAGCGQPQRQAAASGGITLVNATEYDIQHRVRPAADTSLSSLAAYARAQPWPNWPRGLYIERGIPGADPLEFALDSTKAAGGHEILLVLSNRHLYLVPADKWPAAPPRDEASVAALSTFHFVALD